MNMWFNVAPNAFITFSWIFSVDGPWSGDILSLLYSISFFIAGDIWVKKYDSKCYSCANWLESQELPSIDTLFQSDCTAFLILSFNSSFEYECINSGNTSFNAIQKVLYTACIIPNPSSVGHIMQRGRVSYFVVYPFEFVSNCPTIWFTSPDFVMHMKLPV